MTKRKDIDWAAIEAEYRAGTLSNRQIAERSGVSESAIRSRANKEKWVRSAHESAQTRAHLPVQEILPPIDREARLIHPAEARDVVDHAREIAARQLDELDTITSRVIPHIPGVSIPGVDSVPIIGMPGEGVVNLRGMGVLGADGLAALNAGRWPANDRWSGNVTAFRSAGSSGTASLEQRLDRAVSVLERILAATEAGDADNAAATGEAVTAIAKLTRQIGRAAGPAGSRLRTANG